MCRSWWPRARSRPVLDRCYPLTEGAEALRYQEAGHANGKVVMVMGHDAA